MTSLPSPRRRAEEFADAVDAALVGAGAGAPAPAASPLLDVVVALRDVPAPVARAEFTAELRRRLVAEAARAPTRPPAPAVFPGRGRQVRRTPARLVAAATTLVIVGGTAGVAAAAERAIPGDALYPVKRAIEDAEFRLARNDSGRGRNLLDQATSRLEEVQALLESGERSTSAAVADRLPDTVDAFHTQAVQGSQLLLSSFEADQNPDDVAEVRAFTSRSVGGLVDIAAAAPAGVVDDLARAALALQAVDAQAVAICPGCGGTSPLQVPTGLGEAALDVPQDTIEGAGPNDEAAAPAHLESPGSDTSEDMVGVPSGSPTDDPTTTVEGGTGTSADRTDGVTTPSTSVEPSGDTTADPTVDPTDVATEGDPTDAATDPASEADPTTDPTDAATDPASEADPTTDPTDAATDPASEADPTTDPTSDPTADPTGSATEDPTDSARDGATDPSAPPTDATGEASPGGPPDGEGDPSDAGTPSGDPSSPGG